MYIYISIANNSKQRMDLFSFFVVRQHIYIVLDYLFLNLRTIRIELEVKSFVCFAILSFSLVQKQNSPLLSLHLLLLLSISVSFCFFFSDKINA
jgi:hypothetical protein